MPEQSKFENMDLFASLEAIMKQNTGFYQSDLEIDKEIIAKAAASPHREDKTLLWFCRPSGTHCFRERDVFLKDTAPHNTWRFYMEQTSDRVLAYAVSSILLPLLLAKLCHLLCELFIGCGNLAAFVIGKYALALCGSFHRTDGMGYLAVKDFDFLSVGTFHGCRDFLRDIRAGHDHCH